MRILSTECMNLCRALPLALALGGAAAPQAFGKGLEELSGQNPSPGSEDGAETSSEGGDSSGDSSGESPEEAADHSPPPPGATSRAIAKKLFTGTSFGWVHATKSTGSWHSSGMTDLTIGYKFVRFSERSAIAGTYRYAPVAVSGTLDEHSYRGTWETHYLGGRYNYQAGSKVELSGTAEVGYVASHMSSVDGLQVQPDAEKAGAAVALGGGADFALAEHGLFAAGPRLYLGVGTVKSVQFAAAASFLF